MSEQPAAAGIPQWDLADRLRKALRQAGIGQQQMAEYLGVTRQSVSNWTGGRIEPSTQTLRLWALRCGISYEWLCHGDKGPCGPGTRKRISAGQRRVITGRYSHRRPSATPVTPFLTRAA